MTKLIKLAQSQGWEVSRTRNGHWRFVPPIRTNPIVIVSGTPSDKRAWPRILSDLRKSGLTIDRKVA